MDVSVIIPVYNPGNYLLEAVESVYASDDLDKISYEIILVNDGSTDKYTLMILNALQTKEHLTIIDQKNQGPAAARNTGIRNSSGKYLLFLDADNKIRSKFIQTAIRILKNDKADIIHGNPHFFGDSNEVRFKTGHFEMNSMLYTNHIDMCTAMKRSVWERLGGFDENRVLIGFEDWEFWIRAGAADVRFKFVDDVLYDYRINNKSLLSTKNVPNNLDKVYDYVYTKHQKYIFNAYRTLYPQYVVCQQYQTQSVQNLMSLIGERCKQRCMYQLYRVRNVIKRMIK